MDCVTRVATRCTRVIVILTVLLVPRTLWAQAPAAVDRHPFSVQVSAGSALADGGSVLAASFGYSPAPWLTLLVSGERTDVPTRVSTSGRDTSATRGGTMHFGSIEARFLALSNRRVSPFAVAGAGRGVSRPNVNDIFPNRVTNDVQMIIFGGGVQIALRPRLALLADARIVAGAEAGELSVVLPIRAAVAWRF